MSAPAASPPDSPERNETPLEWDESGGSVTLRGEVDEWITSTLAVRADMMR